MALQEIISSHNNFFFDLDGVVWECESLLPGVKALLVSLQDQGKRIYYLSNNAIRSREMFFEIFSSLGIPAELDNIVCAGYSCSTYLKSVYPLQSKIFVIGSEGLIEEIQSAGYEIISSVSMEDTKSTTTELGHLEIDKDVKVVVVGFTSRLNFFMLSYALNCLQNGAVLITGNYDASDKFGKYNVPGSACTVEYLRYAINAQFVNVGKPEKFMVDMLISRDLLQRDQCIMLGDKMATDIKLAKNAGIKSALVLTGVEQAGTFENCEFQPDYILKNLLPE